MMKKMYHVLRIKYYVLSIIGVFCLAYYILHTTYYIPTASATACQTGDRASGLITTKGTVTGFGNNFGGSSGICISETDQAAFVPYKVDDYDKLYSRYFTQSKATKVELASTTLPAISANTAYHRVVVAGNGDITISSSLSGAGTAIIFIEGNLNINTDITYGTPSTGLVFIVKGTVNIATAVNTINAVIVAGGTIYTAGAGCSYPPYTTTSALTINGSLVSLTESLPIKFCRELVDNTNPAENIINQPKYLVILKDLFSESIQKWSEVSINTNIPTPAPSAAASPTPTPTPTPSVPVPTCSIIGPSSVAPTINTSFNSTVTGTVSSYSWSTSPTAFSGFSTPNASASNWSSNSVGTFTIRLDISGPSGSNYCTQTTVVANPTSIPTPTPGVGETPIKTAFGSSFTYLGVFDTYQLGFTFRPQVNGQITKLWSFGSPDTSRTVGLYVGGGAGSPISGTTVSINNTGFGTSWKSGNITPYNVTAGTYYTVMTVNPPNPPSQNSYYGTLSSPFPRLLGNINVEYSTYAASGSIYNDPNSVLGLVDITFVPN